MSAPIAAENLTQAIRQVAKHACSEEDLRVGVEHALRKQVKWISVVTP